MYYWSSDKLFDELNNRVVPERDKIIYYLLGMTLVSSAMWLVDWEPTPLKMGDHAYYFFATLAFPLNMYFSFRKYRHNELFLDRYICLSLPLVIKLLVFVMLISGAVETLNLFFPGTFFLSLGMTASLPLLFWYYYKLYKYMIRF